MHACATGEQHASTGAGVLTSPSCRRSRRCTVGYLLSTSLLIVLGQHLQAGAAADAKAARDARAAGGPRDDQIDSRRPPEVGVAAGIQYGRIQTRTVHVHSVVRVTSP